MILTPSIFTVDSSLALPADRFTAEMAGSTVFRTSSDADRVTLAAGFVVDGVEALVTLIEDGRIDAYEMRVQPASLVLRIRGRDAMWRLQETQYAIHYLASEPAAPVSGANVIPTRIGAYTAASIAREICTAAGLTLSWECRDYPIRESFEAVGRALDLIHTLVDPWSQTEPLGVDVLVQGTTLMCRPRTLEPVASPLNTFTVRAGRLTELSVNKFRTRKIGQVVLTGAKRGVVLPSASPIVPPFDTPPVVPLLAAPALVVLADEPAEPVPWAPFTAYLAGARIKLSTEQIVVVSVAGTSGAVEPIALGAGLTITDGSLQWAEEAGPVPLDPRRNALVYTVTTNIAKATNGDLISMVVEMSAYRAAGMLLVYQEKDTYAGQPSGTPSGSITAQQTTHTKKDLTWEISDVDPITGVLKNQPLLLSEDSSTKGWVEGGRIPDWRTIEETHTGYSYDALRFLTGTSALTRKYDAKERAMVDAALETKSYRTEGPLFVKVTTEQFEPRAPSGTPSGARAVGWTLIRRDESAGSGQRPGGVISGGLGGVGTKGKRELIEPEIRWSPPSELAVGRPIDEALTAIAVTPDAAHTLVDGTFTYAPGPGTIVGPGLVSANRGAWAAGTVYASGDRVTGAGRVWRVTEGGTSDGSEPAWPEPVAAGSPPATVDGTVTWADDSKTFLVLASFTPSDPEVYASAEAMRSIRTGPGLGLKEPEIRWTPDDVSTGAPIAPACNATAVTPDPAHLPLAGTFDYAPPPETIADAGLITASKGAWAADTIYASGDSVYGDGRVWRCTTPGTSGGSEPAWPPKPAESPPGTFPPTPPATDNTVTWTVNETSIRVLATFTPAAPLVWKTATAERDIVVTGVHLGAVPAIRWESPSEIAAGAVIDPLLTAIAVTPDIAATVIPGTFTYAPGPGTIAGPGLVAADKGAWQALTIYAAGDRVGPGDGHVFRASTGGTSGATEPTWPVRPPTGPPDPVSDGTVVWAEESDVFMVDAFFVPEDAVTWRSASARRAFRVGVGLGLKEPEIRWDPEDVNAGEPIDAACNATAVTPDPAHLPLSGTFVYSPGLGTIVSGSLITASKGAWEADTIYAGGDSVLGDGRVWRCTTPGTSDGTEPSWPAKPPEDPPGTFPPTPPATDNTVTWTVNETNIDLRVTFTPDLPLVWKTAEASVSINVVGLATDDLLEPEIRWDPGPVGLGGTLAPACNATAVDSTPGHLPLYGEFTYAPGPESLVGPGLVTADKVWTPSTIYASGDTVGGGKRVWSASSPGTSGGSEPAWPVLIPGEDEPAPDPVADGTVVWSVQTGITIRLVFTPEDPTYRSAKAQTTVSINDSSGLEEPEIRWDPPGSLAAGADVGAACNAMAVTPDPAHTIIAGEFSYAPGPGTTVDRGLVVAARGAWAPGIIYASGDTVATSAGIFRCTTPGTSGGSEPAWSTEEEVADGTVAWQADPDTLTITAVFAPADPVRWKHKTEHRGVKISGGDDGEPDRYTLTGRISTDVDAEPFTYENENLGLEDLQYIFAQLRATSGLWQWELAASGVNIPWIRRGSIVQYTGLLDADGTPIDLPAALMQSLALRYDEASSPPAFTRDMKALAWTEEG